MMQMPSDMAASSQQRMMVQPSLEQRFVGQGGNDDDRPFTTRTDLAA